MTNILYVFEKYLLLIKIEEQIINNLIHLIGIYLVLTNIKNISGIFHVFFYIYILTI